MSVQNLVDQYNSLEAQQQELARQIIATLSEGSGYRMVLFEQGQQLTNRHLTQQPSVDQFLARLNNPVKRVNGG